MSKLINIMLVEDDQLDVIDIRRTFDKMQLIYHLHVAENGEEALQMLKGDGEHKLPTLPDVVLIDINMPKMNGLEFLAALRQNEQWKHLKCFIISTSDEAVDRATAEKLGISGYIVKPLKLNSPSSIDSFNLMIDLMNMKN